ncbi:cyclin-dependent kinase [Chloropicon primus]|nr:cyclin-dependent kinase [Chloropicon primus]
MGADGELSLPTLTPVGAPSGSRSLEDCYEMKGQVGEGMYGKVYKMEDKNDKGVLVATKQFRMDNEKDGFPITAIREIKLLSKFTADREERKRKGEKSNGSDDFVVNLKEIVTSRATTENDNKGGIYMVFEYMEHDLAGIRDNKACHFDLPQIKLIMWQILSGLNACHKNKIIHRDLKCSNVLMNIKGDVKLADFGLARKMGDKSRMTPKVITLWYRPPELLLGHDGNASNRVGAEYDEGVDMWSAGCIMAELLLDKPLLPGKEENDQIFRIFKMFGRPTNREWPGVENFVFYKRMIDQEHQRKKKFVNEFVSHMKNFAKHRMTEECLDLLCGLLSMNPKNRMKSKRACSHPWFHEGANIYPDREDLGWFNSQQYLKTKQSLARTLTQVDDSHEYEQRLKRKREKQQGRPMSRHFN